MSQQVRAIDTREKVLLAAARIFDANGFAGASMAEIVLGTGMTRGAVYFHFSGKADIARAVIERHREASNAIQQRLEADGTQGLQALRQLLIEIDRQLRDDVFARAAVRLAKSADQISQPGAPYEEWTAQVGYRLRQAQLLGEIRDEIDPATCALLLIGLVLGIHQVGSELDAVIADLRPSVIDSDRYRAEQVWDLAVRGIQQT